MLDLGTKKALFSFGLGSSNKMTSLMKNLDYLPQKPSYMLKLLKMVYSLTGSSDEVIVEIIKDRELLSRLLDVPAIKNHYGTFDKDDLKNALATVEKNFLQSSLEIDFAKKFHKGLSKKLDLARIDKWKQAVKSAIIAKSVAKWVNHPDAEFAFFGALLSSLPQLVLEANEPGSKEKIDEKISQGMTTKEAELIVYGFDHTEFGVRLFKYLGLPVELQELAVVDYNPAQVKAKYAELAQVVSFSKFIASCFSDKTQSPSSIWNGSQKAIEALDLKITPEEWGNKISLLFVKSVEFEMSVMS